MAPRVTCWKKIEGGEELTSMTSKTMQMVCVCSLIGRSSIVGSVFVLHFSKKSTAQLGI